MTKKILKGFTLIELLIVIAVLGTLAVVVLIALNPVQQLARTRDSGRSSSVAQLGRSMIAYGTVNDGTYPVSGAGCATSSTWVTDCLVTSAEIQTVPGIIAYSSDTSITNPCTGGQQENGWCYKGAVDSFMISVAAEADSNTARCSGTDKAYYVYSSIAGRSGLWCGAAEPAATEDGSGFIN